MYMRCTASEFNPSMDYLTYVVALNCINRSIQNSHTLPLMPIHTPPLLSFNAHSHSPLLSFKAHSHSPLLSFKAHSHSPSSQLHSCVYLFYSQFQSFAPLLFSVTVLHAPHPFSTFILHVCCPCSASHVCVHTVAPPHTYMTACEELSRSIHATPLVRASPACGLASNSSPIKRFTEDTSKCPSIYQ